VDITDVIEEAKGRGLKFPCSSVSGYFAPPRRGHQQAFRNSIAEFNYQGKYRGVFPIKVNQLREVVEEILDAGKPFDFGLEVGSKPELFAGLALQNQMGSLIICNGYKDAEFIKMALLGIKLGKKVIMVVEKLEELRQIISDFQTTRRRAADRHPRAAVEQGRGQMGRERRRKRQVRPEHRGTAGRDGNVEGGKPRPLFQAAAFPHRLAGAGHPDREKGRAGSRAFYAKLHKMGFAIEYMDVGGGLGVDYDGSRSAFDSSTNYTLQEYTNDIVYYIADVCNAEKVPHPNIISESGRAIVAHHSVLDRGSVRRD
jgi:arginine decarboxylase